jgi:hypothetical protein
MGVVESAVDGFAGLDNAEKRFSADALARRNRLLEHAVLTAMLLTQVAWVAGLVFAAWIFIFS